MNNAIKLRKNVVSLECNPFMDFIVLQRIKELHS